jgi:hypothetical protein
MCSFWNVAVTVVANSYDCPSFSAPLNHARNSAKTLSNLSFPYDILRLHHEIASRLVRKMALFLEIAT